MPEGDTIHRAARTLQQAIGGRTVVAFETAVATLARVDDQTPLRGQDVVEVRAEGKHLLIRFSGGLVLRTHMRMNGSWHVYRPGERWQRPRRDMRVRIATAEWEAVAFNVPVAEFIASDALRRNRPLRTLGPDLAADAFDFDSAFQRMREAGSRPIAEVLLDQRVVAGIGNVYKSELLFIAHINPFAPVSSIADDRIRELMATARRLLVHNVKSPDPSRVTRDSLDPDGRQWVYGRGGKPCLRCGSVIRGVKSGPDARLTFWCPTCQPSSGSE